ncbi:MAG: hypothetical protein U5O15_11065 [Candidatus Krumholzibacteriota bacterium]|nr:hypothetical protein [Candidatus Krumholzibacteriota bacterium]
MTVLAVNDPPVIGGVRGRGQRGRRRRRVAAPERVRRRHRHRPGAAATTDGGTLRIANTGGANAQRGLGRRRRGERAGPRSERLLAGIGAGATIEVDDGGVSGFVAIGTVDGTEAGQAGNDLVITFNNQATNARVQILLRALSADVSSGSHHPRTTELTLNDGDANTAPDDAVTTATFSITGTPNPPVISNLDGDSVTAATGAVVAIDQGAAASVGDPDSANFDGGNLTVARTSGLAGDFSVSGSAGTGVSAGTTTGDADGTIAAADNIYVDGTDIGDVTTDGQGSNNLVITFDADATAARVATVIQALRYASTAAGSHTFDLTVTDAGSNAATSTAAGLTVAVDAVPVNTVPGAQTATDGQALALPGDLGSRTPTAPA